MQCRSAAVRNVKLMDAHGRQLSRHDRDWVTHSLPSGGELGGAHRDGEDFYEGVPAGYRLVDDIVWV